MFRSTLSQCECPIGLVVDHNAHIVITYFEMSERATRNERVQLVLSSMGSSIMLGGLSTFLGTFPLSFSESAAFSTFYYAYLGILTLGCGHGLVFTRVVLSVLNQLPKEKSRPRRRSNCQTKEASVAKPIWLVLAMSKERILFVIWESRLDDGT